jgi:hypothetical protein
MGTFHVAVLAVVATLGAYVAGELGSLEELHPLVGLALFGVLWVGSVLGTYWALAGVHDHALHIAIQRGIGGGAIAGVFVFLTFLIGVALTVAVGRVVDGDTMTDVIAGALFVVAFYGAVGGLVAAIVGGAIGFIFSLVDWVILRLRGIDEGWTPGDEHRTA